LILACDGNHVGILDGKILLFDICFGLFRVFVNNEDG
jgi:hypothetical protein